MPSTLGYLNLTLFCLTLSFAAQLIGFAIPGWFHILIDRSYNSKFLFDTVVSQNFAMWYVVMCLEDTCLTKSYSQLEEKVDKLMEKSDGYEINEDKYDYEFTAKESKFPFSRLREFQIEATCALFVVLVGLIFVRKQKKSHILFLSGKREHEPKQSRHCMTFCYALVSGTLILVPASHFIEVNTNLHKLSEHYTGMNFKVGTPFALISSGVGGILSLLSCLFILGTMCKSILSEEAMLADDEIVVTNEIGNPGQQLVPLVPTNTQQNTGYVDPVAPGYVSPYGNVTNESEIRILTPGGINAAEPNRSGQFASNSGANTFEQPPPSYEESIKQRVTSNTKCKVSQQ